ncbi:MAG: asparagine synthase C-terminal domain-containing protein, partial [Longicatena sp.]
YCKNSHTKLTITQKELLDALDEAMLARNMPGMGDVDSSLLWLCEQVAKEEKVILSGECGDEVFGGYPWFYREEFKDIQTFPWLRYSEQRIQLLNKRIQDFDYQGYVDKRYLETLAMVKYLDSDSEEDKKARLNTVLVLHWFMQTLVTRQVCEGDKAKVNIRAPFANVKLLEYVYNIPWSMKFLNDEEKGILRKAFEDELPTKVAHRKKNPFPKTHNPLYADLIAEKVKERFDDPNSPLHVLFDDEKLKELIDTKGASYTLPWYGQLMSGPQLLSYIYQIDRWICEYHVTIE